MLVKIGDHYINPYLVRYLNSTTWASDKIVTEIYFDKGHRVAVVENIDKVAELLNLSSDESTYRRIK